MISNSIKSGTAGAKKDELGKKGPNDIRSGRVADDGQRVPTTKPFGPKKPTRIVVRKGRLELSK